MKKLIFSSLFITIGLAGFTQTDKLKTTNHAVVAPIDDRAKLEKQKTELKQLLDKINSQLADVQKSTDKMEALRAEMDKKMKELESQDKLGNFEIQGLMSGYNQAETLASSVLKMLKDSRNALVMKQ